MAQPFFNTNYRVASTAPAAALIAQTGQTQGQMFANMGKQIGGMIEQYGLNKEKRAELTGEIEAMLPQYMQELTMSGNEESDKKNMQRIERFRKGDSNMADLKGLAGELAMRDKVQSKAAQDEARAIANEMGRLNLGIAQELKDTRIGIEQDKGVISRLATELAKETNPKKKELLQAQMSDAIANLGLGDLRREVEEGRLQSEANLQRYKDDALMSEAQLAAGRNKTELELLPKRMAATELGLDTSIAKDQATQQILPGQTSLTLKQQGVQSKQLDVENELMDIVGIKGLAQMKADDLKTLSETNKAKLEHTKAYASYIRNKGMADLITAANKLSPTFKERFKPLAEMQGSLLSQNVQVPGENKRVKFSEYLELHNKDSDKYPLTGLAGDLDAQLKTLELSTQNLLREQQVQVNVPDEVSDQSEPDSLKQSIENIPAVRANIEAGRKKDAEMAKQRRDIFNDPNSNIYLY